jgi:hypothetical protein
MNDKQLNCEQRINDSMDSTNLYIKALLVAFHNEMDDLDLEDENDKKVLEIVKNEDIHESSIFDYGLGVDVSKHYRIHLSTGGPASFIEVITTDQNEIIDVYYHYQDWFDGAKRKVEEDSSIYRYASHILDISDMV